MFDDLDASLHQLLTDPKAPQPLREADVSFETPGRDYTPSRPTVNFFLHQVQENRALRDPVPVVDRVGSNLVLRAPSLRVACSYLVTAWSDPTVGPAVRVAQEHRLLGLTLAWLARFATIPQVYLVGVLAGQSVPPPTAVARPDAPQDPGTFWTALGVPPRPALSLVVTVSVDLDLATSLGPPVSSSELRLVPFGPGASTSPGSSADQPKLP